MIIVNNKLTITTHELSSAILSNSQRDHYAGNDPFDGLNSKLFDWFPSLKSGVFGLAWIQLFKLSPVNLRLFLGGAQA